MYILNLAISINKFWMFDMPCCAVGSGLMTGCPGGVWCRGLAIVPCMLVHIFAIYSKRIG